MTNEQAVSKIKDYASKLSQDATIATHRALGKLEGYSEGVMSAVEAEAEGVVSELIGEAEKVVAEVVAEVQTVLTSAEDTIKDGVTKLIAEGESLLGISGEVAIEDPATTEAVNTDAVSTTEAVNTEAVSTEVASPVATSTYPS